MKVEEGYRTKRFSFTSKHVLAVHTNTLILTRLCFLNHVTKMNERGALETGMAREWGELWAARHYPHHRPTSRGRPPANVWLQSRHDECGVTRGNLWSLLGCRPSMMVAVDDQTPLPRGEHPPQTSIGALVRYRRCGCTCPTRKVRQNTNSTSIRKVCYST